jgi:monoamine oxidase
VSKPVTRRDFLNLLAAWGGASAAIKAGTVLGWLPGGAHASAPDLMRLANGGKSAVILGAGISGLTCAWELLKAGYDVTVLEASHRAGGRVFTVRHGTLIDEIGNVQYCDWDNEPHMYFNAGAARIPSTHSNVLAYCKELGVDLEVFINENKTAYIQDDAMLGGKPVRNGEFTTNLRGFLGEMMAKSLDNAQLTEGFSREEMETLLSVIRDFGDLNEDMLYKGSDRAGLVNGGFLEHGAQKDMMAFRDLLQTRLARNMLSPNEGETGPILMQPVGGMDRIPYGFVAKMEDKIHFRTKVRGITVMDDGVEVVFDRDGTRQSLKADYCFNCIPSHLLTGIPNNFPADYVNALKYIRRGEAYKAAFQAKERFWEKEGIYGGITWINSPIQQIWYPTQGIHKAKGVTLAAYNYGGGMHYTKMTQEQRVEELLHWGEKVHPNYRNLVEKPVTIAWHRMDNMLGCSARFSRNRGSGWTHEEENMYHLLQNPVNGRHFLIGDQIAQHNAWMEAAMQVAHLALGKLDAQVRAEAA